MDELKNTEIKNLYKIRDTTIKTLFDRGYEIPEGVNKLSFTNFKSLYEKNRHHLYFPDIETPNLPIEEKKGGGILVYFEQLEDFSRKTLEARIAQLDGEYPNLDRLFFVLKSSTPLSTSLKSIEISIILSLINSSVFLDIKLLYDIASLLY